jgi:hypothetical protein
MSRTITGPEIETGIQPRPAAATPALVAESLPIRYNFTELVRVLTSEFSVHYSAFPKLPSPIYQRLYYTLYQNLCYTLYQNLYYTLYQNLYYTLYQNLCYTLYQNLCYTLCQSLYYTLCQSLYYTLCLTLHPTLRPDSGAARNPGESANRQSAIDNLQWHAPARAFDTARPRT